MPSSYRLLKTASRRTLRQFVLAAFAFHETRLEARGQFTLTVLPVVFMLPPKPLISRRLSRNISFGLGRSNRARLRADARVEWRDCGIPRSCDLGPTKLFPTQENFARRASESRFNSSRLNSWKY